MMRMLTFAAGGAIGYVLGAKAGRERYDQIRQMAGRTMEQSRSGDGRVAEMTNAAADKAARLTDTARQKAHETIDLVDSKVDTAADRVQEQADKAKTESGTSTGQHRTTGAGASTSGGSTPSTTR